MCVLLLNYSFKVLYTTLDFRNINSKQKKKNKQTATNIWLVSWFLACVLQRSVESCDLQMKWILPLMAHLKSAIFSIFCQSSHSGDKGKAQEKGKENLEESISSLERLSCESTAVLKFRFLDMPDLKQYTVPSKHFCLVDNLKTKPRRFSHI